MCCAVCAVGVSGPDNGPDGKMLPARSRWRRPPATILPIVFFVCLFCFRSVLSDRGCGYMESGLLESLNAAWAHVFLIPAERLFHSVSASNSSCIGKGYIAACLIGHPRAEEKRSKDVVFTPCSESWANEMGPLGLVCDDQQRLRHDRKLSSSPFSVVQRPKLVFHTPHLFNGQSPSTG